MTLTATARVATDSPDRYAKQLASHLGRASRSAGPEAFCSPG